MKFRKKPVIIDAVQSRCPQCGGQLYAADQSRFPGAAICPYCAVDHDDDKRLPPPPTNEELESLHTMLVMGHRLAMNDSLRLILEIRRLRGGLTGFANSLEAKGFTESADRLRAAA